MISRFPVPNKPFLAGASLFVWSLLAVPVCAQGVMQAAEPSVWAVLWKWMPLLLSGFQLNIVMSVIAMAIGTVGGVMVGIAQLSPNRQIAWVAWAVTHFFRNAPWLVVLFFIMFLVPFQITIFGYRTGFPDWIKATVGLSIPVIANISEVTRGAVQSIPNGQWESAEALGFSRMQVFLLVILPQCVRRMLPPWMNWYAILLMATVLASIVGVADVMTVAERVSSAEARQDLLVPLYAFVMGLFFVFCYPMARLSHYLEKRSDFRDLANRGE